MIFDILSIIPGKKKRSSSGWYSFNAICCHHRGHKADRRGRAGIRFDGDNWAYHCFNCNFKCGFQIGKHISKNTRQLLSWCGIDDSQISKWNLINLQNRDLLSEIDKPKPRIEITFEHKEDPEGCVPINNKEPRFRKYVKFLESRGLSTGDYMFKATPNARGRNADRIIIPFRYNGKKVGHTSRYIDSIKFPKYINDMPPGFLFGTNLQKPDWEVCLVFEGVLDALSLRGCALMHNTISDTQATLLQNMHKKIIVVPDMDKTGLEIIDRALELGFHVSLPEWGPGIKDANDAIVKYGRLPTLLSILQNATNSKIKLEVQRKKIAKRI